MATNFKNKPMRKRSFVFFLMLSIGTTVSGQATWSSKYDSISKIASEGFFIVYKNSKAGYADEKTGKEVVLPKYDKASSFSGGLAIVGKRAADDEFIYGIINKAGKEIVLLMYGYISDMKDGIAIIELNDKYGLIDKTGKRLLSPKYTHLWPFSGGMAAVGIYDRNKGEDKWGFIDQTGKEIVSLKYDRIYAYKEGIAVVEKGEKKYFTVNKTGKETLLNYDRIGSESYDRIVVEVNKKFGFINSKGEVVVPLKYDNAYDFSKWQRTGYLANVSQGNKSGFIDTSGREVVPLKYDLVGLFREGLARVTMDIVPVVDSKNGYIDSTGNLVIPMIYNSAGNFSEGLAAVSKKIGKSNYVYAYIDMTGKVKIPFDFESAQEFSGGLAAVKKNGKYGFIDKEGKEIIAFKYDRVHKNFKGGRWDLAEVELNGKTIKIDKTGKEY